MLTAYCDGACRVSNPGQTSAAWVLYDGGIEIAAYGLYLGPMLHTNNYAEFWGLILLLSNLECTGIGGVTIYCDSQLVVNQVNIEWAIKNIDNAYLAYQAYAMLVRGRHKLIHVKGHDGNKGNERADQLANEALDRAGILAS